MPNGRGAQGEAQRSEPLPALRPVRLHPSRLLEGAAVPLRGGDRRRGAAERGVAHPRGDAAVRLPEAPGAACGVRPRHRARSTVLPAARGRDAGAPQALPRGDDVLEALDAEVAEPRARTRPGAPGPGVGERHHLHRGLGPREEGVPVLVAGDGRLHARDHGPRPPWKPGHGGPDAGAGYGDVEGAAGRTEGAHTPLGPGMPVLQRGICVRPSVARHPHQHDGEGGPLRERHRREGQRNPQDRVATRHETPQGEGRGVHRRNHRHIQRQASARERRHAHPGAGQGALRTAEKALEELLPHPAGERRPGRRGKPFGRAPRRHHGTRPPQGAYCGDGAGENIKGSRIFVDEW